MTTKNQGPDQNASGDGERLAQGLSDALAAALSRVSGRLIRDDPEAVREILEGLCMEDRVRLAMHFHGSERLNLILACEDARGLVRGLPAPELWISVKELGDEDALDLIRMADPSQVQHIFDLEWWHKGRLDPLAVAYWIALLNEAGPEAAVGWFSRADEELVLNALARFFQVHKTDPDNQGAEPWRAFKNIWTMDDVYYLHFLEPNLAPVIERFLTFIRAEEPMRYYGLLDAIETAGLAETEECAFSFRAARLEDHGFVDFEEALNIYAPLLDRKLSELERNAPEPREKWFPDGSAPASEFPLSLLELPDLFRKALSLIADHEVIENIRLSLGAITNRIMIADDMDLTRLEAVNQALEKAHSFVEMGLERWAKEDPERAAHLLRTQHLFDVFRAGFTEVLQLGLGAQRLKKESLPAGRETGIGLLGDDGLVIEGLAKPRPRFYAGADNKGTPIYREFRTVEEVERAGRSLARARALAVLFFDAFRISRDELKGLKDGYKGLALTWETVFLTAVGQALSGGGFRFAPLEKKDAAKAFEAMLTPEKPRRVRTDVRDQLLTRVDEALSRLMEPADQERRLARAFVVDSLEKFEREAENLDFDDLDPRYLEWMVISAVSSQ
jgi:hypothetical protein